MKKPSVKERVMEAASRLFYFSGYNQTGINQIIDEAKVAKASMYQHFRSKEDIAVAYLQARHDMWMGKLLNFVASEKKGKKQIIKSFDYLIDWLNEVEFRGCGFQNIITDLPKGQKKIKDIVEFHKDELSKWINEMLKIETGYNKQQRQQLNEEVLVLIEGAIMLSQIKNDDYPIFAAQRACVCLLANKK